MPALLSRELRTPLAYALAAGFAGLAILLIEWLQVAWGSGIIWLALIAAVIAAGAVGGRGPALLAAALGLLAVDYFLLPAPGTFKLPYTREDAIAAAIFVAASGLAAAAAGVDRQVRLQRALAAAAAAQVNDATRYRQALLDLGSRALAGASVDAICREAAVITASAMDVEHCAILVKTREGDGLTIAATDGREAGAIEGLSVSADVDMQVGYALHTQDAVVITDTDAERRFSLPPPLRAHGARSGVAARIGAGGRAYGVVLAYSTAPRAYDIAQVEFVTGVAATLAGAFDRRRIDSERAELAARDAAHRHAAALASRRATFLAQTATVLDAALEPEATLVSLARLAVPALADCAIVDLVHEEGYVRRVEVVDIDPTRRETALVLRRMPPNLRGDGPFSRAIRTGQSALLSEVPEREPEHVDPEHGRLMRELDCQSLLLIPLVARGQTLGLLTLASRERGRLYEAADLSVAQELAGRAAIALDNARLHREAQAASRAKDDFLAIVSHELRTPINAVLGWAAMLREQRLDATRAEYACDAIERSARAQAQLIEQLLDVSRAISGKLELHLAPAHLGGIIDAAIDAVRPDAEAKHVRIASRIDRSLPLLTADPARLQQVMINLIANAVKFSPEEGLVQVELRRDDSEAEIVVRDQGIGIKREFLPYVFERFRQDAAGPSANRGLGLGMSIARDIVERHGGTITAESAGEGKGATFTVRLPLRAAATRPAVGA